jgi:hypothetical protein
LSSRTVENERCLITDLEFPVDDIEPVVLAMMQVARRAALLRVVMSIAKKSPPQSFEETLKLNSPFGMLRLKL